MVTPTNENLMFINEGFIEPEIELLGNPQKGFLDSVVDNLENSDFFSKKPTDFIDASQYETEIEDSGSDTGVKIL